ncbi:MAG: DUF5060 domain-containing protein [Ignavibacteriales bacterium]|nr:DUF5060 domain-containing protein [Ignavibacteriales bacterium]
MNKYKSALILTFLLFFLTQPIKSQDKKEGQLFEYVEWSVTNSSFSGNPFDLISNVTFIHQPTNKVITTQMFYDGNNTWKFRFTGTRLGLWKYYSVSSDEELNGINGEVNIIENTSTNKYGFLTNVGNKFAIQISENKLKGFLFNVYMNGYEERFSFRNGTKNDFRLYKQAIKNGCSVIFLK